MFSAVNSLVVGASFFLVPFFDLMMLTKYDSDKALDSVPNIAISMLQDNIACFEWGIFSVVAKVEVDQVGDVDGMVHSCAVCWVALRDPVLLQSLL